ncbi:MAG TPA: hypothetical protein VI386_00685 [Candidatus Sulfotelmatobacter sp.]
MKKAVPFFFVLFSGSLFFISCGKGTSLKLPPSKLSTRVMVSQSTTTTTALGGLFIIDAKKDKLASAPEIQAGSSPGMMAISPNRATLLVYDSTSKAVQVINTTTESTTGSIALPGNATSIILPATTSIGYAAVPTAANNLWSVPGAIEELNLTNGGVDTAIGVPGVQTVVSNNNGAQLLAFSPFLSPSVSNQVRVISPLVAVPPVDQGCETAPNSVCTAVGGFDQPVTAVFSGNTVYVLNCGAECGGAQASVQALDLATLTAGPPLPVDAATYAFLSGTTLYIAGTSPTNNSCAGQTTAATSCGRLDVVDLNSMTVSASYVITDGYHDRMDMSLGGQLFIGASGCTEVGNVNNPSGEVRGCLSIFNTTNNSVVIPPDNGDVTGLQGFTSRAVEYVVEGNTLRIYDTTKDALQTSPPSGGSTAQISLSGQLIDVKAVDFF